VKPDGRGLRLLYVTLTRATQRLQVVHAGALPEALAPQPHRIRADHPINDPINDPMNDPTNEVMAP
jgi:hypothetical protein